MGQVSDARDVVAETLAWLLYTGSREVAEWASEAGWLLVVYEMIPRKVWERECDRAAKERGDAFRFPNPFDEAEGKNPSSHRL